LKRLLDVLIAILALLLLSPIFVLVWVLVWLKLGSPVFFKQDRPGLEGKAFKLIKFRTMKNETHADGVIVSDEARLIPFGQLLRATSVDELPELWNVLKGEMSLVGPRPLLMEYLPLYTREQMRRHDIRPGITGWAQVNGRNNISWEEKLKMDVWYVDNRTFWLDLKILLITVKKVFFREDINQKGHVTAEKFKGNDN
jgi:lipopolysaccharide/colanic/teichoic acid biosynthesis glycosyltransferase